MGKKTGTGEEVGRAVVSKESVTCQWAESLMGKVEYFLLLGSAIIAGCESSPFWSPDST